MKEQTVSVNIPTRLIDDFLKKQEKFIADDATTEDESDEIFGNYEDAKMELVEFVVRARK